MSFPSITLQGNILTYDLLEKIAEGSTELPKQTARDYGQDSAEALRQEIQNAWGAASALYDVFSTQVDKLSEGDSGATPTRNFWVRPLLGLLSYELQSTKAQMIDERSYAISHAAENLQGFPVHIVGANQSLDKKGSNMRMSPHALVQEYLNRHENLYALVTNGKFLRLLRDSSQLTKLSYVEFDLTRMFAEKLFPDFAVLYRLLHVSRMPEEPDAGKDSVIEKYHDAGLASGSRIREKLSGSVEQGILQLGTGLLQEPVNEALRQWVDESPAPDQAYYDHLLKLIYRLLFLMVIEGRELVFPAEQVGADAGAAEVEKSKARQRHRRIYEDHYSVSRLRGLAERYQLANERQYDLWENLLNTFRLFENEEYGKYLGIAPLAGDLFTKEALGPLYGCRINNRILLETLRGLSQFDNGQGGIITVNYANLDVEEFGSVYEGLLEYDPVIDKKERRFRFVSGQDRSSSGSHYTPDELVQPLIKHSLEHLIGDRTVKPEASKDARAAATEKLLALNVCDVACGSGHILLAAARRIGLEVARLETQEEQPNPAALRRGTRRAIQNCIYGVDKNPLAVELCKVALWLEAHVPGEPLNFLDHRIRNGDAIVGLGRIEELENGIATEAFKAYTTEEKENLVERRNKKGELLKPTTLANALKARNKAERKAREKGDKQLGFFNSMDHVQDRLAAFRRKYAAFAALPERTVEEIRAKEKAYRSLSTGSNWWFVKCLADLQLAQFFISKTDQKHVITDGQYFDVLAGRESHQSQAVAKAVAESSSRKFFHWFLEFPEVLGDGGFDCVLGNPPFLGGKKISTVFGKNYLSYLSVAYKAKGATTNLVTYFPLRDTTIIQPNGIVCLITSDAIAKGDSRIDGLNKLLKRGYVIGFSIPSIEWPGDASTMISIFSFYRKETYSYRPFLINRYVDNINSSLYDGEVLEEPFVLSANFGICHVGSQLNGKGFILGENSEENRELYKGSLGTVVYPYLTGADITESIYEMGSRLVINFHNWPERKYTIEEWSELTFEFKEKQVKRENLNKFVSPVSPEYKKIVASDQKNIYDIALKSVKPERTRWKVDKNDDEVVGTYALRNPLPQKWWVYSDRRPMLYRNLSSSNRSFAMNRHSKHFALLNIDDKSVFSEASLVLTNDNWALFGEIMNTFHQNWAWRYSGKIGSNTLRYSSSQAFDTYPFFKAFKAKNNLNNLSEILYGRTYLLKNQVVLSTNDLYNQFHNPHLTADYETHFTGDELQLKPAELKKKSKETYNLWRHLDKTEGTIPLGEAVERIAELRKLHKEMDEAVLAAYGWHVDTRRWGKALRLRHDFYEVDYLPENDRVRYTIHPEARREVLKRLLLLNHEIHEAEERGVDYDVIDGEKVTAIMQEQVAEWLPPGGTEKLHWKTLKFLCSGEDLLPNLERSLTKSYKPFVTSYASGLENELYEKIFVAYHAEFQSRYRIEDGSQNAYLDEQLAVAPKQLDPLYKMLRASKVKVTLGTMQQLLAIISKPNKPYYLESDLLQDFRAFVLSLYEVDLLGKPLISGLQNFISSRNNAAHIEEVKKEEAVEVLGTVRGMVSLLVENEK